MVKKGILVLGLLLWGVPALAMNSLMYRRVMEIVDERDLAALQDLVRNGVDLNSPLQNGMTPLCETVLQGDYEGYEMLQTQGASPYVSCIRQLPQGQVAQFYANQPSAHTYYAGRMGTAYASEGWGEHSTKSFEIPFVNIGEVLLGGIAVAGILTLGHDKKSGDYNNTYDWSAPLNLEPSTFETEQYNASHIYGDYTPDSMNFLGAINASSAYARGYTGYKVKRSDNGALIGVGEEAITEEKVKVAVVDEGVWTDHDQLKGNILQRTGKIYNFVYGPCSAPNPGNRCWEWDENSGVATLYVDGEATDRTKIISEGDWLAYKQRFLEYEYDPMDAKPTQYDVWVDSQGNEYGRYYVDTITKINNTNTDEADDEDSGEGDEEEVVTRTWYIVINGDGYECSGDSEAACTYGDVTYTQATNYMNHGTHVAGLVAAERDVIGGSGMLGVAYNADIIPIKFDQTMGETLNHVSAAVNLGADIVNFSSATDQPLKLDKDMLVAVFDEMMDLRPDFLKAYQRAAYASDENGKVVQKGTILVFAAGNYIGNEAPYDSSILSIAPLSDSLNGTTPAEDGNTYNLTNLLVNVVALDDTNKNLAWYSAKCGATKDYCIAAPGGVSGKYIYSTTYDGSYTYEGMQGTSMAAPIVSGALAVIKGAFPHLTNQQVVQILFETAKPLGDPELYGHGLVDLDAATNPIGLQSISFDTTASGQKVNANTSTASVPAAFSNVATALPNNMIVLDKYDRAFAVPTSSFVHVAKRENKLKGRFKSFMSGEEKVVANTDTFHMAYSERHSDLSSQMKQGSVSFEFKPTPKWSFKSFYSENTETSGGTYFERIMASPYAKMKEAWGGAVSYEFGKNWRATVQGQVGKNGYVNENDLDDMDHNRVSVFQSSLQYNGLKHVGLKVTTGISDEQGSVLGMWGKGAFKAGNSHTTFVGAGVTLNLTDALTLEGMYYSGTTKVNNGMSLLKMSNVKSESFAMTAAWRVNEGRTIGLQFVSPLRVRKGTATVDLPVARDAYQDRVYRQATKADLKASAREYDIGLYYADALQEDVHLQSELGVRLNPDHVAGAAPDWRALMGIRFGL